MATTYDAILVGGGHNGLVAAGYLARAGLKVAVLERRPVVGGPCSTVEFFPGFRAGYTNSSYALIPKVIRELKLREFGLEFIRPDPTLVHPFEDGRAFVSWRDRTKTAESLRQFSEHDAEVYGSFFGYFDKFAERLGISIFGPPPSLKELVQNLTTAEDEEMFGKIVLGSLKDILDEWFESEEVKAIVAIQNTVNPPSFAGTPWSLMIRPLSLAIQKQDPNFDPRAEYLMGSSGLPRGGMGAITQAMAGFLRSKGATVRTEAAVSEIIIRNGRAVGAVLADGEEIYARIVVSNLSPKSTFLDLVPAEHLDEDFRSKIRAVRLNHGSFRINLALDGVPRYAAARSDDEARGYAGCQFRTIQSLEHMERVFDECKYGMLPVKPLIWGLTPSIWDDTLAPPGKNFMAINVVNVPYRLRESDWETEGDAFAKRCLDELSIYIPNIKDILIDYSYLTPVGLEREFGMPESDVTHGDIIGHNFSLRPVAGYSRYRSPIPGLYMCGSGNWPSPFVSGLPGHNAGHEILKDIAAEVA